MKKQLGINGKFWTRARAAFACAAFAATALVGSNCKSNDTANLSSNQSAQQSAQKQQQGKSKGSGPTATITSSQPGAPPRQQQQAQLDTVPPLAWNTELQSVEGAPFRLSDYKDKVVILDLWATWCGPCRLEVPHLVEMANEYKGKGIEVIGLTTENPATDAEKVRNFAQEFKINYKLGYARADVAQSLMAGNFSIPQTFVIAPGGRIVTKFRGFSSQKPDMIRAAVAKANEKAGD